MDQKLMDKMIKKYPCVISSVNNDGYPEVRAMLNPRLVEDNKYFYFSTNTSSTKIKQFKNNNKASVYFSDSKTYKGLLFVGEMEVLHDQDIKDKIWQFGDTIYYSKGVTDPDYCVLRFTAKKGRFYNNFKVIDFDI